MSALVAIVSGFASGVFLRSFFMFGWPVIAFMALLGALAGAAALLRPRPFYPLFTAFLLCATLGAMRTMLADTPLPEPFATSVGTQVSYEGVVVSDPDVRDTSQRAAILVKAGAGETRVLAVAERHPALKVGERVAISGVLQVPAPFSSSDEGGRVFRYDTYLEKDGIRFIVSPAALTVLAPSATALPTALAAVRSAFANGLDAVLPEPYASLAAGIVVGGKSGLGNELQNAFVATGLVQIIVLSGYNVMIVAEWAMFALSFLKASRRAAALAGVIAIALFVAIAGASSTALRAALMAALALYARAEGRTYAAGRALFAVVFLMLLWNPLLLAYDPGFDLSVAATAGLIWLAPRIEPAFASLRSGFFREIVATTVAAQAAVLPLLLYDTGNLSLLAIPANLLVTPLMPAAMAFAALAAFAGMLLGSAGVLFALPAYLLLGLIVQIAEVGSKLPFAALHLPAFPFLLVPLAYTALIYFAASAKRFSTTLQFTFSKKAST